MTRLLLLAALAAGPALAAAQGLGIDLSAPAQKPAPKATPEKKAPEKKAAPAPAPAPAPVTLEGLDMGGGADAKARMDAARRFGADGAWESAAVAYDEILRDRTLAAAHDEARFRLAQALEKLGLDASAFAQYEAVLAKGPQGTRFFQEALAGLFSAGSRLANDRVVLAAAARYAGEKIPAEFQDRTNLLLARYHFERGRALVEAGQAAEGRKELEEARRLAALVPPPAPAAPGAPAAPEGSENLAARARFVNGTALYALGDQAAALESFKDVVRLTNPRRTRFSDPVVRELAFLQLARIHYEHKQNRYAIWYFAKMPWGEPNWLEGLWEASYAHYRIGDYERSLGNLLTLHSPYFADEYFPESFVLKAVIYFENCRYPEARSILEDFHRRYEPVYQELVRLTARQVTSATFYDEILTVPGAGGSSRDAVLRRVKKIAMGDDAIYRLDASIRQLEEEMDRGLGRRRAAFRETALAKELRERLASERAKLVDEAGARVRQKLEAERDDLKRLLEQALRIKIEVSRRERDALEASLAKGAPVSVLRPYKYSAAVSDEHEYWPYEGESWRDELGTYSYTLTRGCREGPARPSP